MLPWDEQIASQVTFYHSSSTDKAESLFLKLDSNNNLLLLWHPQTKQVIDCINVYDIIGAEIEIRLDEKDKHRQSDKAILGREKMEALENVIGKRHLAQRGGIQRNEDLQSDFLPLNSSSALAYINIYAYPRAPPSVGIVKKIKQCFFPGTKEEDSSNKDNIDPSLLGHRYENHRRYKLQPTEDFSAASSLIKCIRGVAGLNMKNKKFLVIVNPFSGTKSGKTIYETIVKKMMNESSIEHDVLITEYGGHAIERMTRKENEDSKERDISEYDGLIVLGGDGILSEVLQGLHKRDDYDDLMKKLQFGIVGCGTSNGLAASILYAAKERYGQLESTFLICKGRCTQLDLAHYETVSKTYTSFLTFSWGMIADIDIESEVIRFMGILRNDIWAVWRLINLRSYKATFSYLPADKISHITHQLPPFASDLPSTWVTVQGDFILFWASQVTHASVTTLQSPHSKLQDGVFNILVVRKPCSRWELMKILLGLESGTHVKNPKAEFYKCVSYRLDPQTEGSFNDIDGEVVEPGRIQGHVIPSSLHFLT